MSTSQAFVLYRLPKQNSFRLLSSTPQQIEHQQVWPSQKGFIISPYQSQGNSYFFAGQEKILQYDELLTLSLQPYLANGQYPNSSYKSYTQQLQKLQKAMHKGDIHKAVLSRVISVERDQKDEYIRLFTTMSSQYPDAFVYMASIPGYGLWCGATPEHLAHYQDAVFSTMALAGTQQHHGSAPESIHWGHKEEAEQAWVQKHICQLLNKYALSYTQEHTHTKIAAHLAHICTPFSAQCKYDTAMRLAQELHPTPAVCGSPTPHAKQMIAQTELHNRDLYSGFLGPVAPDSFQLYVNLRCMQISPEAYHIFVGGGITTDSEAHAEWQETATKAEVMKKVIIRVCL